MTKCRGSRRRRVCRDEQWNLGDPHISSWIEVLIVQVCETQGCRNEFVEVGVSHNSDEASNVRGAKGWQIDRAQERNNVRTQHRRINMVNET